MPGPSGVAGLPSGSGLPALNSTISPGQSVQELSSPSLNSLASSIGTSEYVSQQSPSGGLLRSRRSRLNRMVAA